MKWRRKKKPGTDLVIAPQVIDQTPPPREEYDFSDFIWRCKCGSVGTSRESLLQHVNPTRRCNPEDIREYVPREVYEEEYTAKAQELSVSGIWIVIKMPTDTPEGSIKLSMQEDSPWDSRVLDAKSGLDAIQKRYLEQVDALTRRSDEIDREGANGRYIAIDFFTGHRSEALVTAEWRANVTVAEGSDQ